jgi:RNA polymerase sigma-70 factor (ECF subfamily)
VEPDPGIAADSAAAAFESLFAAHHDDLLRYAARRVGVEAAADVVAEVFLVAWRRRGDYSSDDRARLWLFGVAHHVVANEHRSERRRSRLWERARAAAEGADAPDPADAATTAVYVRAVLGTLSSAEQEALRLTEWERLDIGAAAQVAGCSSATFRVRLHRARRHLAARLVDPEPAARPAPRAPRAPRANDMVGKDVPL